MKAARLNQWAQPLEIEEVPPPAAGQDQLLVRVRAAAVNPFDRAIAAGYLAGMFSVPRTMGTDVAGDVVSGGSETSGIQNGEAVYGFSPYSGGAFAEYMVINASQVARKPQSLSYVEAASVPLAGTTAWQAINDHLQIRRGERLLIQGAGGAVGMFAVQFAKMNGAYVIGTAASQDAAFLHSLGIDEVIEYDTEQFEERASDVDVVYSLVGGEVLDRSIAMLKPGARLLTPAAQIRQEDSPRQDIQIAGQVAEARTDHLALLADLIDSGQVKVVVLSTFTLTDAQAAMEASLLPLTRGKTVIAMD